ncbi:MAG: hypothetical protein GY816_12110 [Cytophagales bacterium]|nr:hypothetical protein [Cytophagales bacterium]
MLACQTNQHTRHILARREDIKCTTTCLEKFDKSLREHRAAIDRNNALILEGKAQKEKFGVETDWEAFQRICYSKFGYDGGNKVIAAAGRLSLCH